MHELALCEAIVATVSRHAEGQAVERVDVRIGNFRQVVPDSLQFSWQLLTEGTELAGCELVIDRCRPSSAAERAGEQTDLDLPILLCRSCDSTDVTLVSGEEFQIVSIDRTPEPR